MIEEIKSIIKDANGKDCIEIHKTHYDINGNIVRTEHEIDGIGVIRWYVEDAILNSKLTKCKGSLK